MKKKSKLSNFKYYYKQLVSHHRLMVQDKRTEEFLKSMVKLDMFLMIIVIAFLAFRSSKIISYITSDSFIWYIIMLLLFLYSFLACTSYTIYQIISFLFEKKNKHELLESNIRGYFRYFYFLFLAIHFPWIFLTCMVTNILNIFKIDSLKEYIPVLVCGYLYFVVIGVVLLQIFAILLDYILKRYPFLLNHYVNNVTYIYIAVLVTIIISKHIPTFILGNTIKSVVSKNSMEYKRIFRQYHLLNYYFLVAVTVLLKALNFNGDDKVLIDALFYTTNALTLFTAAKEKAGR